MIRRANSLVGGIWNFTFKNVFYEPHDDVGIMYDSRYSTIMFLMLLDTH